MLREAPFIVKHQKPERLKIKRWEKTDQANMNQESRRGVTLLFKKTVITDKSKRYYQGQRWWQNKLTHYTQKFSTYVLLILWPQDIQSKKQQNDTQFGKSTNVMGHLNISLHKTLVEKIKSVRTWTPQPAPLLECPRQLENPVLYPSSDIQRSSHVLALGWMLGIQRWHWVHQKELMGKGADIQINNHGQHEYITEQMIDHRRGQWWTQDNWAGF